MLQYENQYPDYYSRRFSNANTITIDQLKLELFADKQDNKTLLEYYLGEENIYLFLIKKDDHRVFELPLDFSLAKSIDALEAGLCSYFLPSSKETTHDIKALTEEYVSHASLLYEKLILPVHNHLTDEITIVPDNRLHFVPFELLLTETPTVLNDFGSYPYLLRDKTIGYAFNLRVLRTQIKKTSNNAAEKQLLAMAPFVPDGRESGDTQIREDSPLLRSSDEVHEGQSRRGTE